jgi:flagellar biosynthesis protein FlhF
MQIKRFEAPSVQEALQKVKSDLGSDAVILFTKKIKKGGIFGWLGTPMVEVTAGVDPVDGMTAARPVLQEARVSQKRPVKQGVSEKEPDSKPANPRFFVRTPERRQDVFQSELSDGRVLAGPYLVRQGTVPKPSAPQLHPELARIEKILSRNGVDEEVCRKLLAAADQELTEKGFPSTGNVSDLVLKAISGLIRVSGPIEAAQGKSRVIAFVGPTGVGKSTNLVKLASQYALFHRLKVGLVTADTYRIGAVEQLKIYRDIIDLPLEIISTPEELGTALRRQADRDLIFFDTAGRSPQNKRQLQELKALLEVARPAETHLVLSATTKNSDLLPIVARFGVASISRLLFTKLDETRSYGSLLNLCAQFTLPLSYLGTGQNVPNDIEVADPDKVASLVMGEGNGRPS